jgi:hypothetical protein
MKAVDRLALKYLLEGKSALTETERDAIRAVLKDVDDLTEALGNLIEIENKAYWSPAENSLIEVAKKVLARVLGEKGKCHAI